MSERHRHNKAEHDLRVKAVPEAASLQALFDLPPNSRAGDGFMYCVFGISRELP